MRPIIPINIHRITQKNAETVPYIENRLRQFNVTHIIIHYFGNVSKYPQKHSVEKQLEISERSNTNINAEMFVHYFFLQKRFRKSTKLVRL